MISLDTLFIGDDAKLLEKLKKSLDISNIYDLAANTNERKERSALSKDLDVPQHTLYYYSKLANLLQCDMSLEEAKFLVETGVRCINDIFYLNCEKYLAYVEEYGFTMASRTVDKALVTEWISTARMMPYRDFECDESDQQNQSYTYHEETTKVRKASTSMGVDLRDIISELGAGLADAQKALDMNSIAVQKEILSDPELRGYGLNATWYTIPETTFSLKMTYHFSEESAESLSGTGLNESLTPAKSRLRMRIVPSNATINNTYKSSGDQESTVTLRFVPIPPPEGTTDRIQMPELVGKSVDEAIATLNEMNLEYELVRVKGEPKNGSHTEVLRQSLSTGATITDASLLDVAPDTYVMAHTRITLTYLDDESGKDPTEETLKAVLSEVQEAAASVRESAADAKSSAADAKSSADAAQKSANNAKSSASDAKASADAAQKSANNAKSSAADAKYKASAAESSANEAQKSVNSAKSFANNAEIQAKNSEHFSTVSQNAATSAASKADDVSKYASKAEQSAIDASSSAKAAKASADEACEAAGQADCRVAEAQTAAENAEERALEADSSAQNAAASAETALKAAQSVEAAAKKAKESAGEEVPKDKSYQIKLFSVGKSKMDVIKEIRAQYGIGLSDAKTMVDNAPCILLEDTVFSHDKATAIAEALKAVGADAEIIEV